MKKCVLVVVIGLLSVFFAQNEVYGQEVRGTQFFGNWAAVVLVGNWPIVLAVLLLVIGLVAAFRNNNTDNKLNSEEKEVSNGINYSNRGIKTCRFFGKSFITLGIMGLVALLFLEYSNITLFDDLNTSETIAVTQFYGWSEVFCFTFGAALLALSTIAKNSAIIAMYIGHTNGNIQTKTVDNGESKVNDAPKEE